MKLWGSCITFRGSYLYTCFSGICSFITTNLAYQDTPTYPDTLTGPCLDKLEPSAVWVRGSSSELATGVCPAYRLTASDGLEQRQAVEIKSWRYNVLFQLLKEEGFSEWASYYALIYGCKPSQIILYTTPQDKLLRQEWVDLEADPKSILPLHPAATIFI